MVIHLRLFPIGYLLRGHSKSMFAQDSRVLTPVSLPPCSLFFCFQVLNVIIFHDGLFNISYCRYNQ